MDKYTIVNILKDLITDQKQRVANSLVEGLIPEKEYFAYVMKIKAYDECVEMIKQAKEQEAMMQNNTEEE